MLISINLYSFIHTHPTVPYRSNITYISKNDGRIHGNSCGRVVIHIYIYIMSDLYLHARRGRELHTRSEKNSCFLSHRKVNVVVNLSFPLLLYRLLTIIWFVRLYLLLYAGQRVLHKTRSIQKCTVAKATSMLFELINLIANANFVYRQAHRRTYAC